jgi:hypothetical protein
MSLELSREHPANLLSMRSWTSCGVLPGDVRGATAAIRFPSTPARRQNQRNSFSLAKLPICKKRSADGALSIVLPPKGKALLAARKLLSENNLTA